MTNNSLSTLESRVIAVCQDLHDRNGLITPRDLIDVAREDKGQLHDTFDWDDSVAGEKWRNHQARELINHISVTLDSGEHAPVFINVRIEENGESKQGYKPVTAVMADDLLREQVLTQAIKEIQHWEKKYKRYQELIQIINQDQLKVIQAEVK